MTTAHLALLAATAHAPAKGAASQSLGPWGALALIMWIFAIIWLIVWLAICAEKRARGDT